VVGHNKERSETNTSALHAMPILDDDRFEKQHKKLHENNKQTQR
jgi:hypothetical protein